MRCHVTGVRQIYLTLLHLMLESFWVSEILELGIERELIDTLVYTHLVTL